MIWYDSDAWYLIWYWYLIFWYFEILLSLITPTSASGPPIPGSEICQMLVFPIIGARFSHKFVSNNNSNNNDNNVLQVFAMNYFSFAFKTWARVYLVPSGEQRHHRFHTQKWHCLHFKYIQQQKPVSVFSNKVLGVTIPFVMTFATKSLSKSTGEAVWAERICKLQLQS